MLPVSRRHEIFVTRNLLRHRPVRAGRKHNLAHIDRALTGRADLKFLQHDGLWRFDRNHDRTLVREAGGLIAHGVTKGIVARVIVLRPVREIAEARRLVLEKIRLIAATRKTDPAIKRLRRNRINEIAAQISAENLRAHDELPMHTGVFGLHFHRSRGNDRVRGVGGPGLGRRGRIRWRDDVGRERRPRREC